MAKRKRHVIASFQGEHRFLSNFWKHPLSKRFRWRGELWYTGENAYQAAKATNRADMVKIQTCGTPGWAKRIGNQIKLRPDWEEVKVKAMLSVVRAKFSDPELRDMLLATGDAVLIEGNNWGDTYWGQVNGKGRNMLGKILMKVRKELREKHGDPKPRPTKRTPALRPVRDPAKPVVTLARLIKADMRDRMKEIRRRTGNVFRHEGHGRYPSGTVYVGRYPKIMAELPCPTGRAWGNPFKMKGRSDEERERVIKRYTRLLLLNLADDMLNGGGKLLSDLAVLGGHHLVCHCVPKACHGDSLSMVAAWASIQAETMRQEGIEAADMAKGALATGATWRGVASGGDRDRD